MTIQLKTLGHATLVIVEDGEPLIATDPWLIGSTYWRSWWLEKYPTDQEMQLVRSARFLYITHSHPDHFHWPSLRHLGPHTTLHPRFPAYGVPDFLEQHDYPASVLEPWRWYSVSDRVRVASVPTPVDDSILIIETPSATVLNINDANPREGLLKKIRQQLCRPTCPIIVLKSYSPASAAVSTFRNGERVPLKTRADYASTAQRLAEASGAAYFVPFASQAFFNRKDSRWANEHKVTYDDLLRSWDSDRIELCQPFVTFDLDSMQWTSSYSKVQRDLDQQSLTKVALREEDEATFELPADFDNLLAHYLGELHFLSVLFRRGIGWKLSSSREERFYDPRRKTIVHEIPHAHDLVITLPDKVLYEALQNNVLTDLGITMFIRVDTRVDIRVAYFLFVLMGLHDYGHSTGVVPFMRFLRFYLPYLFPATLRPRPEPTEPLVLRRASPKISIPIGDD